MPVSEKARVVLGIKGLDWRSVQIPRLPPKPDLMPLTGGYRLTQRRTYNPSRAEAKASPGSCS